MDFILPNKKSKTPTAGKWCRIAVPQLLVPNDHRASITKKQNNRKLKSALNLLLVFLLKIYLIM